MKLYSLLNLIIYRTDNNSIKDKLFILLSSKNFYFIKKYLIYQLFLSHIMNDAYLDTSIELLLYFNNFIPEIVEIVLNYSLIQLKESYKKHDCFILKTILKFITILINKSILDEIVLYEFVCIILNQRTYFALYVYLLLKIEIKIINDTMLEYIILKKKNKKIFYKNHILKTLIEKNVECVFVNGMNIKKYLYNNKTFKINTFKISFYDILYTFKSDLFDDCQLKEKNFAQEYIFFIKTYLKNFFKLNDNKKTSSIINLKFQQVNFPVTTREQKIISATLKRKIYLIFMSSLSPKEAVLKLFKIDISNKNLSYIISILIECCIQEDKFLKYYSQIAEILCKSTKTLKKSIEIAFLETCKNIFRYKINKIKISGNFFGYLFSTGALSWKFLSNIIISIHHSSSSMRIFLKYILITIITILGKDFLKKIIKDIITNYYIKDIYERKKIINLIYSGIFKDYDIYTHDADISNKITRT
uniref:mRNA splicing factor CWC22 n=1 Tax=Lotharella vacuolata TaxID=74820 RepID=A0A0H5BGY6_9EUKA|nr:mRNA splicing factor CWC22 [Lotharella vacuolata]